MQPQAKPAPVGPQDAGPRMLPAASLQWGAQAAEWTTGLWDCFDDMGICCKGLWCPCCLYGDINEHITGDRDTEAHCCMWFCFWACVPCCQGKCRRTDLRKMYGLKGKGCCEGDCCAHTCCFGLSHCCAQCQEVREIEFRKHALNTSQRQAQQAAAPPAPYGQPGQADPYAQQYAYAQPSSPNGTQGPVSITINHTNSGSREMQSHGSGFQPQLLPTNAQLVRLASGQVVMVSPVTEMPHMGGANMQNVQMGQILELPQVSADNSAVVPPQEQFIRK